MVQAEMIPATAPPAIASHQQSFSIKRTASIDEIEAILAEIDKLNTDVETAVDLRLVSGSEAEILADLWSAIAAGSLSKKRALRVVAWGLQREIEAGSPFTKKPAFWVGLAMATAIKAEVGDALDSETLRRDLAINGKGLIDTASASEQALIEFDPDYSIAPVFRGREGFAPMPPLARQGIFNQLVLGFRKKLEIGAIRRGVEPVNNGPALGVTKFLSELHENGLEHGSRDASGKTIVGTRYLRLKKHVANNKNLLLERCCGFAELARHVEAGVPSTNTPALIEASVSDYGLGIVDGFLSSATGRDLKIPRDDLLLAIIYERLSSKSADPSAGLGIQKALSAAQRMGAFVSVRTGEFWLTASFADSNASPKLCHRANKSLAKVAGTHWQIFWQQH